MLRICFLTDSIFSVGGVQRVTAAIASLLAKNHHVSIITMDSPADYNPRMYGLDHSNIEIRMYQYPHLSAWQQRIPKIYSWLYRNILPQSGIYSDWYAHSSFPLSRRQSLVTFIRQGHYDIVIGVHAFLAIRLATISKQLPGVRTIGWIHNSLHALIDKGSPYLGNQLSTHYGCQLRKLDEVVVLYHQDALLYQQQYQLQPKVIYNPLTLTPSNLSKGTSKRFLAIGRFSKRHKGFDLLIEAFNIFAKHNYHWHLDIVGEGEEEPLYQALIIKYHLQDRITLHPFTTDISYYYAQAQIFVLSSRWEGLPLVLAEAMAHGLPIITSDLATCKEVLGDTGLYFSNGDINQLAQRLEEATHIDWQQKSKEMLTIVQKFKSTSITAKWEQLILNTMHKNEHKQ